MYGYKFIKGDEIIEGVGYNIWSGAENCGIRITKAFKLSKWYLQETKFEDRVRTVYGIKSGEMQSSSYEVHQKYNK
jgi:hypothetical protein